MKLGTTMKSRLLLINVLIAFLVIAVISSIFFVTIRNRMREDRVTIIAQEVQETSVFIEREFSKIYETTQALQLAVIGLIESDMTEDESREYLLSYAGDIIEHNNNVVGVNFVFEEDVIGQDANFAGDDNYQFDGQFISYVVEDESGYSAQYLDNYQDYEFYTRAVAERTNFFTNPYYFNIKGEEILISTVVFPIIINGEYLGMVGLDFTASYILDRIQLIDSTYERRDIIVSQDGRILINSANESDSGKHISTIHTEYFIEMAEANASDTVIGTMELQDHLEITQTIELASSGEFWYVFSDIDNALIIRDINQVSMIIVAIGAVLFIAYIIVLYFSNYVMTKPIVDFTEVLEKYDIETSEVSDFNINTRNMMDLRLMIDRFIDSFSQAKSSFIQQRLHSNITNKQLELRSNITVAKTVDEVGDVIVDHLCNYVGGVIGALYVNDENRLLLRGTYGTTKEIKKEYELGEGLVGLVAKTRQKRVIRDKEIYQVIDAAVDDITPPVMLLYPFVLNNQTIAVLEIVSLQDMSETDYEYFNSNEFMICNAIMNQLNVEETSILFEKTKQLANELEEQQEELRSKNEELESQQEELRVTNEELETQQEELRITNKELEFNLDQIEKMNRQLEQAQTELEQRTIEAEQSNKYKSEFLANMSHELRTPLNSILILSNLIQDNDSASDKMKEYATNIHSAGADLLELINGILDLSKVESGQDEVNISEWSVLDSVNDWESRYGMLANNQGIEFNVITPEEPITLRTDQKKVHIILQNLLSNAIKFTKEGHVNFTIKDDGNEVLFVVEDTGVGIKPEDLDLIFEEFKQAENDSTRSFGGTGLGLAISKRYANKLSGRIHVESVAGEGSTFTLILPKDAFKTGRTNEIVQKQTAKPRKLRPVDEGVVPDDRHRINDMDKFVLIIDDDDQTLKTLRDYFNRYNVKVIVTNTGENGLFLADYYMPSMILLDINLPKMSGNEIKEKLALNPRTEDIPVVFISGETKPEEETARFYQKPLSEKDLKDIVFSIPERKKENWKILFIEDDELHLRSMVEYTTNHEDMANIFIEAAVSKKDALKKAKANKYSLIVTDLSLPDAKGFEIVSSIRNLSMYKRVPIIVYTGKRFNRQEEEELSEMVDDIIIKAGKSPERLINDIQLFLRSYKQNVVKTDLSIFKDKTVLVVDDDIRNIFALTGLLEAQNINVVFNTSGKEALDRLNDEPNIDLILMDIMMPEMDGYETTKRIRAMESYKHVPIIALTAKTMRGDREKCIQAGATEYLSKPLNKEKLFSVLRIWLQ